MWQKDAPPFQFELPSPLQSKIYANLDEKEFKGTGDQPELENMCASSKVQNKTRIVVRKNKNIYMEADK